MENDSCFFQILSLKILFLVCPLWPWISYKSLLNIKYRTSDTCLPVPFFPQIKGFEFTSGACWYWRKLVSSLSDYSESPDFHRGRRQGLSLRCLEGIRNRVFFGVFKRRGLCGALCQRPFCLFSPVRSWKARGGGWGLISLNSWTPGPGFFPEAAPAPTPAPAPSLLFADGCCPEPPHLRTMSPTAESADQHLCSFPREVHSGAGSQERRRKPANSWSELAISLGLLVFLDPRFAKRSLRLGPLSTADPCPNDVA